MTDDVLFKTPQGFTQYYLAETEERKFWPELGVGQCFLIGHVLAHEIRVLGEWEICERVET